MASHMEQQIPFQWERFWAFCTDKRTICGVTSGHMSYQIFLFVESFIANVAIMRVGTVLRHMVLQMFRSSKHFLTCLAFMRRISGKIAHLRFKKN